MTGAKILVVEDEAITAMEIRQLLETSGYQPYTIRSGDDAVKNAFELKPDLILMNIGIKEENNCIKTVQMIREFIEVPFIYLTTNSEIELLESIKLTNPSSYIFKPFLGEELISNIEIALQKHEKWNRNLTPKIY